MAIMYTCRHCGTKIGTVKENLIDAEAIGLHTLTEEEKIEMISYGSNGDIVVKAICEDCHEALSRNPELHQYDYFIH